MFKGNDLIIAADGKVIAASKSCSIEVNTDIIPVTSATNGDWMHNRAGRKSWRLTTSHLLPNVEAIDRQFPTILAESPGWGRPLSGLSNALTSRVTIAGRVFTQTGVGLHLYVFEYSAVSGADVVFSGTYNTANTAADITTFNNDMNAQLYQTTRMGIITSADTFFINLDMADTIAHCLQVLAPVVTTSISPRSIAMIGGGADDNKGIHFYFEGRAAGTHAKAYIINNIVENLETPLKSAIQKVGQTLTMQFTLDGHGSDRMSGDAICRNFKATGTLGNLLQGSFTFEGTGPLT